MKHAILALVLCSLASALAAQVYFSEDWSSTQFGDWTIEPDSLENWFIQLEQGNPAPTALFNWSPQQENYESSLVSPWITLGMATTPVLQFDLLLNNYSNSTIEYLAVDVRQLTGGWVPVGLWNNQDMIDEVWSRYSIDITSFIAMGAVQVRFRVSGEDSTNLNHWAIDNILVQEEIDMGQVQGSVVDNETFAPIPYASVYFNDWHVMCNGNGAFNQAIPQGIYNVSSYASGYQNNVNEYTEIELTSSPLNILMHMDRNPAVFGTVYDELNDEPIAGATVYASNEYLNRYYETETAADGSYNIYVDPGPSWQLEVTKPGEYEGYLTDGMLVETDTEYDFWLTPEGWSDANDYPEAAALVAVPSITEAMLYPIGEDDWYYVWFDEGVTYNVYTSLYNGGSLGAVMGISGPSLGPPFSDINPYSYNYYDSGSGPDNQPYLTFTVGTGYDGYYLIHVTCGPAYPEDIGYYALHVEPGLPLNANFEALTTTGPGPLLVDFVDLSTGNPTGWTWAFGDGETSEEQSPSHTYQNPGVYSVKLTVTNGVSADSLTRADYIDVRVYIFDEQFRVAINDALDYTGPDLLTHNPSVTEMASIYALESTGTGIEEIDGAEYLVNCGSLILRSNMIHDLTPLADISSLTALHLENNNIASIAPLAGLGNLTEIGLSGNMLIDPEIFANFTGAYWIAAESCDLTSVAPFSALPLVWSLNIKHNSITDLAPLNTMPSLTDLHASDNDILSIAGLAGMQLEDLRLARNGISDLSPLADMTSLTRIDLADNEIEDITPLDNLDSVHFLDLSENIINRIEPLAGLAGLWVLNLNVNNFSDIYPLTQNESLVYVSDSLSFLDNPISQEALNVHVPELAAYSWGYFHAPAMANDDAPCYPSPTRDAQDVPTTTTLEWQGHLSSEHAYNVMLWNDDLMEVVNTNVVPTAGQTAFSVPVELEPSSHYTWTVVAHNAGDSLCAGIWGFHTAEQTLFAEFDMAPYSGTAPLEVNFTDLSTTTGADITEWHWDFQNDGIVDSIYYSPTNPSFTYYDEGRYYVSLTVTNGLESNTYVSPLPVDVDGSWFPPGAEISGLYTADGGPYVVEGDAWVPEGDTLTIVGAQFGFLPGARLNVLGTLEVQGGFFVPEGADMWGGIYLAPTATGCNVQDAIISAAVPGVEIEGCMPQFHRVTIVVNDDFTLPPFGWAVYVHADATPWLQDVQVTGYKFGILLENINPPGRSTPTLTNIRVRNSGGATCDEDTGILMQSATAMFDTLLVEDYTYGITVENWVDPGTRSTPTLTNIRVRNSGGATREDDVGLYLVDVECIHVDGDSIVNYTTGIVVETTDNLRSTSTPTLTNIRVRNSGGATRTGSTGIKLYGQVNGSLSNITTSGYASGIEIAADSLTNAPMAPELHNVTVDADTLITREPTCGVTISGSVSCMVDSLLVQGYPSGILIDDVGSGLLRATPTLTNIRVRNSGGATRVDTVGIGVVGAVNLMMDNAEVEDFATGILLANYAMRANSTPTLTNIRVRNSGGATRTETWGVRLEGGVAATVNGLEVEDCTYGVYASDFAADGTRATPTLTNIRIRNSGGATREPGIGVWLMDMEEVRVDGDSIVGYPIGIQVYAAPGRASSTPTLTNIRVRNSGGATRPENVGIQLEGSVTAVVQDVDIYDFDYGIHYTGSGVPTRATPTLTNIRVRNSGGATRQPAAGIVLVDVPGAVLVSDSVYSYPTGFEVANNTGSPMPVTIQHVHSQQPVSQDRLDGHGVLLGSGVSGTIMDSHFEGHGTGAMLGAGNSTVQGNSFCNCDGGVDLHGGSNADVTYNLFYLNDDYPATRDPGPAMKLHGVGQANLGNNTVHNYNTGVQADSTSVTMRQSIIWHNPPLEHPVVLNNASMNAFYNDISFTQAHWGDSTNINANPEFEDPTGGDFKLSVFSPCIDAGDPNGQWDPEGNAPDIGAFRYPHMAQFDVNPRFALIRDPVQFTDLSLGHPQALTLFEWDFNGDGTIDARVPNPQYTFDAPGTYDIFLRVTTAALVDSVFMHNFCVYQEMNLLPPQGVRLMPQGNDLLLQWEPVTHNVAGDSVHVDFYLVYAANDPAGVFAFVGFTPDATPAYMHSGVLQELSRQYYIILAFSGTAEQREAYLRRHAGVRFAHEGVQWIEQSARH